MQFALIFFFFFDEAIKQKSDVVAMLNLAITCFYAEPNNNYISKILDLLIKAVSN